LVKEGWRLKQPTYGEILFETYLKAHNIEFAPNGTVTYTYNASTNTLASKTDAKNQKLLYAYDGYNRLTTVTLSPSTLLRTYYYDTNPLDTTGFSQNILGRLAAVQYASQSGVQLNDMYSYTAAGTNGAGLPAAKRLQVNEPGTHATLTANLDSTFTYNSEGKITWASYPATGNNYATSYGPTYNYS